MMHNSTQQPTSTSPFQLYFRRKLHAKLGDHYVCPTATSTQACFLPQDHIFHSMERRQQQENALHTTHLGCYHGDEKFGAEPIPFVNAELPMDVKERISDQVLHQPIPGAVPTQADMSVVAPTISVLGLGPSTNAVEENTQNEVNRLDGHHLENPSSTSLSFPSLSSSAHSFLSSSSSTSCKLPTPIKHLHSAGFFGSSGVVGDSGAYQTPDAYSAPFETVYPPDLYNQAFDFGLTCDDSDSVKRTSSSFMQTDMHRMAGLNDYAHRRLANMQKPSEGL